MPVYRAIGKDVLRDPRATMLVADSEDRLAGYVIAVTDWRVFWRSFLLRHLLCAAVIAFKRAKAGILSSSKRSTPKDEPEEHWCLSEPTDTRSWADSSPVIAKILHVGVDSQFRGRGIGSGLYREILGTLAARGVRRVDACIDRGNVRSLQLHAQTGWRIHRVHDGYFATIDLKPAVNA